MALATSCTCSVLAKRVRTSSFDPSAAIESAYAERVSRYCWRRAWSSGGTSGVPSSTTTRASAGVSGGGASTPVVVATGTLGQGALPHAASRTSHAFFDMAPTIHRGSVEEIVERHATIG